MWALRFSDIAITPLARVWSTELAMHPRSGMYFNVDSEIDIARVLEEVEQLAYVPLWCLALISGLTYHSKVCWARSIDSCGCSMWHAAGDTVCACTCMTSIFVSLWLISNVINSNTRPLYRYRGTVSLNIGDFPQKLIITKLPNFFQKIAKSPKFSANS